MEKNYYLGLDMGTSSVGWAVTDENYNLMRKKGKDLWGVRLFKEAKTSAERRVKRTSRRRLQREKARIGYLKELFADEINKVDAGFYQRMEDSKFISDDKTVHQKFTLFSDTNYTDEDYYNDYPTIFHLRKKLIESDDEYDVRMVFLALLNMYKHRGHFLNANLSDNGMGDINEQYDRLKELCSEYLNVEWENKPEKFEEILKEWNCSNSLRNERLLETFNLKKTDKEKCEMLKLICGLSGTLSKIFKDLDDDSETKKMTISFRSSNYDEEAINVEEIIGSENFEIIAVLKEIHDWSMLANIMRGKKYLSVARVEEYEKHKDDLKILKKVIKEYSIEEYNNFFRVMADNNYSAYVNSVNSNKESTRRGAKCDNDTFFKEIKKIVNKCYDSEEKEYILKEIEKGTFLPKQIISSNGVIPNQVHKIEMKKILQNAEKYLPFLTEKDDSGLSVSERILQMFSFQIPYYIGPISGKIGSDEKSKNSWSVRKEKGRIYPWNFKDKIDEKESAEKFIERMVNHCTYLNNERVLPKNSLLYEKFMVLNELNNLKINNENISVELKQSLYNNLFKTGKKVTAKGIKSYLERNGLCEPNEDINLTGIDGDFTNRLSNYAKFKGIFNTDELTYEQWNMAEKIIKWSTIYGDSKKFLEEKIRNEYSEKLDSQQIKRILGIKFRDWGRLSEELLNMEGADVNTGEIKSVIGRMWDENYNLMELIATDNFTYKQVIKEKQNGLEKSLSEIDYDDLDELYVSAPVKRMIWQTLLIIKELVSVIGYEPTRVFVEMAKDVNAEKKRTDSRKKKFLDLYKQCEKEERDFWIKDIDGRSEAEFRKKKLYLYYTQKGRCMYTGEQIDLSDLFNDNLYDIDHIYPRHFVKDDSIENNLVLVKKEKNAHKSDTFPIEDDIRKNQYAFWKMLYEKNFITKVKYQRLTRKEPFSDEEKANFIMRQIVETRQGTKVITDILEKSFDKTQIVYVKAGNVSLFRQKYECIKCREINDFHHANDAYLNIVVGNVYDTKFTSDPRNFIKEYRKNPQKNEYHMYKLFDYNVQRGDRVAWTASNGESMKVVKGTLKKNTPLVTFMSYEEHGGLYDQNIISAKDIKKVKGKGYLPIKSSDSRLNNTEKYGGYAKVSGAYFFVVEHTVKNVRIRTIEPMPCYLTKVLTTKEKIEDYCCNILKYDSPVVKYEKIKMYSLIKVNGYPAYLTGRGDNRLLLSNAIQIVLSYDEIKYIKDLIKVSVESYDAKRLEMLGINRYRNEKLYDTLNKKYNSTIYKQRPSGIGNKLNELKENFYGLSIDRQIHVLIELIKYAQRSNTGIDLSDFKEGKTVGKCRVNKKISDQESFELINKSVTGLYENKVDLLRV